MERRLLQRHAQLLRKQHFEFVSQRSLPPMVSPASSVRRKYQFEAAPHTHVRQRGAATSAQCSCMQELELGKLCMQVRAAVLSGP